MHAFSHKSNLTEPVISLPLVSDPPGDLLVNASVMPPSIPLLQSNGSGTGKSSGLGQITPETPPLKTEEEPPSRRWSRSLTLRVVLSVCLTASATLLLIGVWQSELNRREALGRIQSRLKLRAQAAADSVVDSFWRMDRKGARKALSRSSADKDIYAVYLLSNQGEFWDGLILPADSKSSENLDRVWEFRALSLEDWKAEKSLLQGSQVVTHQVIRQNVKAEEGIIGTVVLVPNQLRLRAAQWQAIFREMLFVGLLDAVLIIVISLTLHRSFLKPILHFGRASRALGRGDYKVRLVDEVGRSDEIGEMARAFNFMAQESEAHTMQLEARVQERTRELASANHELNDKIEILRRSQEEVIENRKMGSLGRMASGFAHEVNTPLSASLTAAYLVEEALEEIRIMARERSDLDPEFLERIEEAISTSETTLRPMLERAGEHVQSLKRIASLQMQQNSSYSATFDVVQTVRDLIKNLTPEAHRSGIALKEPMFVSSALQVKGNPASLTQAFENILRNAMLHAFGAGLPPGTVPEIEVNLSRNDKEVILSFRDNGRGISSEDQQIIYDPYVTGSRGAVGRGSVGLGLYFVRQVLQSFQGRVWCESALGMGSTFYIALPLIDGHR